MTNPPTPQPSDLRSPMGTEDRSRLIAQVTQSLRSDVLAKWIPGSLDHRVGGFQQDFAENWSSIDRGDRDIVFQSRLIWLACKASQTFPECNQSFQNFANHGVSFLRQNLWDSQGGGFFWRYPQQWGLASQKHAYGNSFAIYALAAHYEATGDPESLEMVKEAFAWLESKLHDKQDLGYFEVTEPELPKQEVPSEPESTLVLNDHGGEDAIGTPRSLKSMNTHIHLLEAFTELFHVWPNDLLRERLTEIYEIILSKVTHQDGYLHIYLTADWNPVPSEDSYGHDIETAFLIVEAAEVAGFNLDRAWSVARKIVDHTLRIGEDKAHGGVYDHGHPDDGPESDSGRLKIWWVQGEALNALLLMHEKFGHESREYWDAFLRQWEFIKTHQIDKASGGWFRAVSAGGAVIQGATKSDGWTEGYHHGRALMNVRTRLEKVLAFR